MASKFRSLRLPTFKESLVIAAVVALVGFFSLHLYYPQLGVIGNAMDGSISITNDCPENSPGGVSFSDEIAPPFLCGMTFRYRWVLIGLVVLVAGCWFFETRKRQR